MKIVIAMDSFKGSMTSLEAGNAAKKGVLQAHPNAEVIVKPLADGGEGTVDALIEGMQGKRIDVEVSDPLGRPTWACYGILPDGTAVMEMAQAAGLTKLEENERNPLVTSTYGVGEMIADAIDRGCRKFIIGIGGSATNDGGTGMLSALGYILLDGNGQAVPAGAQGLSKIAEIRREQVIPQLCNCEFKIACDVDNPLCGENGATYVYGPQKGLKKDMCHDVDAGMQHYAQVVGPFCQDVPGAGAAGGLGFAFLSFLHGTLVSGVDLILDTVELEQELSDADVVITGEGRIDYQTSMGKAPIGVASYAKQYGCKVLAFAGCIGGGAEACTEKGLDAYYAIASDETSLQERMERETAMRNMQATVATVLAKTE